MYKIFIFFALLCFSGCTSINQSIMFRTGSNYNFKNEAPKPFADYKVSPNDIVSFSLYSNDGYKIIEVSTSGQSGGGISNSIEFLVDKDGNIRLPVIGKFKISGLTTAEAEKMLEEKYAEFYQKPFIILKVLNKRVLVFPGNNSMGTIVNLKNENTTLIEVITMAGGISTTGKAKRVKIIRGEINNPQIQLINLSTIEGLNQASLIVQPNDIIYIESTARISQEILTQISPIISLLATFLFIYDLTRR